MSSSTVRKNRAAARAAGTDKKMLAAQEAEQKARKSKRRWIIGTIAVVLCIALVLFLSSPVMYRITTAVSVGDKNYSPADVKFIRANSRNSINFGGYTLDYDTVSQYFGEETAAQMLDATVSSEMVRKAVLLNYARENNISLTAYEKQLVAENADAQIAAMRQAAKQYGVSLSTLLSSSYGAGVNEGMIRSALSEDALANKAMFSKYCSLNYSPDELKAYYADPTDADLFSYALYLVKADDSRSAEEAQAAAEALVSSFTEWRDEGLALDDIAPFVDVAEPAEDAAETAGDAAEPAEDAAEDAAEPAEDAAEDAAEPAEAAAEPAEDAAEPAEDAAETAEDAAEPAEDAAEPAEDAAEDAEVAPEEALKSILAKNYPEETLTVRTEVLGSSVEEATRPWLSEEGRAKGDITTLEAPDGEGWYVVLYLDHTDNTEPVAAVRHILIKAEAGEDGTYSDEAKAAAKAKAQEILDAFNAGDKSELSFATLAYLLSEDSGSRSNGGLYASVEKGQMVPEFDEFCFADHAYGDTGIVYGESAGYAGYHVMFYVEKLPARDASAREALRSDALTAWSEEVTEGIEPVKHWAYKLVK